MKAIIMAGGKGTRLRPLTCNIPKPMMPIMQKPIIQYIIELLKKYDITEIGITLQYLSDEITSYFGNGKKFGVNLQYFIEKSPLGTAGSVRSAEDFLDETFVVVSGDALTDINLTKVLQYHKQKKSTVTIVLKKVDIPLEYGVAVTDECGKIDNFIEKPGWSEIFSDKVNTGIYVMEPKIFKLYNKNKKIDFSKDLFPVLLKNNEPVYGYVTNTYWRDIGNIEQFMECNFDVLNEEINVKIDAEKCKDGVWMGKDCIIEPNVKIIPPVYIGDNCKILSNAEIGPFTVLGRNSIVSEMAALKRSIVFENCYVGKYTQLRGAIVSNNVQIGKGVSIFEECSIGSGSLIGERSIIKAGVKIWPYKVIGSRAIIKTSIMWGKNSPKVLFGKNGVCGEVNVEITPEFVSKLASAFAAILKLNSKVIVCSSSDSSCEMLKYSFMSGLVSMGMQVYSAEEMTIPMIRLSTVKFNMDAAVYLFCEEDTYEKVNILFIDKDGIAISKSMQRKIVNNFVKEDFIRMRSNDFKRIRKLKEFTSYYEEYIISDLKMLKDEHREIKIAVWASNEFIKKIAIRVLNKLNIQCIKYDNYISLDGLKKEVLTKKLDFGVNISENCSEAILIDEKGTILNKQIYESIKSLVLIYAYGFKTIAVPVNSSAALKKIAQRYNCKYIRTKISERHILNEYIKNEKDKDRKKVLLSYLSSIDALSVIINVIDIMLENEMKISEFIGNIPNYILKNKEIACSWDKKGSIMRKLMEKSTRNPVELIEGIKFNYDDSWALVIPDSNEPICKIYAESCDEEKTEKIIDRFENEIHLFLRS
ncbi:MULTISPECIES: sugar phosphate nucleotidyltransferase [Clostridium]|uniref:sugar phosphate nucleotidyltransferase n=1 Tax=Clostridium TaxID=1485 RepID=UPI000825B123|nr:MULTISPECIES: sugar phosphate nucleotidyltransferase [Clostridium]PJI09027.1 nucleotidyltransferase [Clostridium sp. CT7]